MSWWAAGNARQPLGPQSREAQRLDRRVLGVTRAGSGPAPQQNIFIGRTVIIFGTGPTSGLFAYNGTPAGPTPGPANPPQVAIVPTGVTADPYGNAIATSKILIQSNVITESGGIFRTAAAAPLLQLDGPHNAFLAYDASSVLKETIAPVATTDGLGSTVQTGFTTYGSVNTTYSQLVAAALQFHMSGDTSVPALSEAAGAILNLSSGTVAGLANPCTLSLNPSATIPLAILQSALELLETAAPAVAAAPLIFGNTSGHVEAISDSNHGDSNSYDVERLTLIGAATTINSSTVRVNVFSKHLGVGTYKIHLWMVTQNTTAADAAAWSFNFTGTATGLADFTSKTSGTAVVGYAATTAPFGALGNGQGVAGNQSVEVNATLVVTVAGTLTFGGLELVSGNTVTVSANGQMDFYPVVAT